MNKDDKMLKDDDLDALFTATRKRDEVASADFMGRLLGDAAEVSASRAAQDGSPTRVESIRPGFWALLADAIGGWRGGVAITSAMLVGIYIGFADPAGVDTVSGLVASLSGDEAVDDANLYDLFLEG